MSASFDPYREWLDIPADEQPPHYYRLLGLAPFAADPQNIRAAAERQIVRVSAQRLGRWSAVAQRVLNELAAARDTLVDAQSKAVYDAHLGGRLAAAGPEPFQLPEDGAPHEPSGPPDVPPALPAVVPPPLADSPPAPPPAQTIPPALATPPAMPAPPIAAAPPVEWTALPPGPPPGALAARAKRRRFWAKGIAAIVLISAAAAVGGGVFLNSVLRQIDQSRSERLARGDEGAAQDQVADSAADDAAASDELAPSRVRPAAAKASPPRAPRPKEAARPDPDAGALYEDDAPAVASATPHAPAVARAAAPAEPDDDVAAGPQPGLLHREHGPILHVAVSPDGREALSLAQDLRAGMPNSLRFWSVADGGVQIERPLKLPADVTIACYAAAGRELFVGTGSGKAQLVALDGEEVLAIGRGAGPLGAAIATRNSALLYARPSQLALEGWDRTHSTLRVACAALPSAPAALGISADNSTLLTAGPFVGAPAARGAAGAAPLQLWQIQPAATAGAAGEPVFRATLKLDLTGRVADLSAVALRSDGRQACAGGRDGRIHVFDLVDVSLIHSLAGHTGPVARLSLSADGARLVSGGIDSTVRAWDVAGGIELMRYAGHAKGVTSVAIAPDGRTAISGGGDGQIRIWRLPAASAAEQAAAVAAAAGVAAPAAKSIFEPAQPVAAPAKVVAAEPEPLPKPPAAAAQQRATAAIRKLFAADFAAAKDPDGKLSLAEVLLGDASAYPVSYRYAMLDEARNLAAASGYVGQAQCAIAALAEQFDVDLLQITVETFEQLARQPLRPKRGSSWPRPAWRPASRRWRTRNMRSRGASCPLPRLRLARQPIRGLICKSRIAPPTPPNGRSSTTVLRPRNRY